MHIHLLHNLILFFLASFFFSKKLLKTMVSMEADQKQACKSPDNNTNTISNPRISFSYDLDDNDTGNFKTEEKEKQSDHIHNFEFLSNNHSQRDMSSADELFFEGKLLPYWQTHHSDELKSLKLNIKEIEKAAAVVDKVADVIDVVKEESRVRTWFIDDDPSPRPPKCTVLWKELLRLKSRQKGSTLSPSASSSSSSSSSSLDMSKEKESDIRKKVKKGLERTRSASIGIRPMVNVPICTQSLKQRTLPPLFPMRLER